MQASKSSPFRTRVIVLNEVLRQAMFCEFACLKGLHEKSTFISEYFGFYD